MRRDLPKGWLNPELYPEHAEIQRQARAEGISGLAELCRRMWRNYELDAPVDAEVALDGFRLIWKAEDAMAKAWVGFWSREGVDVLRRTTTGDELGFKDWLNAVFNPYAGPAGEGLLVGAEWQAVMTDALVRALEKIGKHRGHLTDEDAEEVIYREFRDSLDRAYSVLIEEMWDELDPDVQSIVESYWGEEGFQRGIKALLLNNLNGHDRVLLDAVLTVKYHMEQEGAEASDTSLWRRVAEKLGRPVDHANRLKQQYYRLMKRLNAWIPTLARHYARDPSGFDPFREAERLLAGEPGSPS